MNLSAPDGSDSPLLRALKLQREESMSEQIDAFGQSVAKLRDEAVTARKNSGIEDVWRKCEEAYLGIDDANRAEFDGQAWAKPMTMDSPITRDTAGSNGSRSTIFVKLTSRYVDASAARMGDILLPVDDKPFSFDATPIPELEEAMQQEGAPVADFAKQIVEQAAKKAKAAEKRVWDWQSECNFAGELRKVVHDAARLGVGVIKGPVPMNRKSRKAVQGEQGMSLAFENKIKPGSLWVDPWNLYPAPDCGENIHDGSYLWEEDTMSAKQLQALADQPGYLATQIKKVLKEGPGKRNSLGAQAFNQTDDSSKHKYEVWHFYGQVSRKEMTTVDAVGLEEGDEDEKVDAILTIVNDSVIRATMNPLDSGAFPYDTMSWKRRSGNWAGCGVAEDLFSPQRMINGATRRMNDTAGLSAGVQIVIDRGAIYPEDGSWEITPNKIWCKSDESGNTDVRQAFSMHAIPSAQAELMNIIQYALRVAEESAGLPLIAQGQSGPSSPDTYGAAQLQNNNANTMMRRVAKAFDDGITKPQVNRYYEWLMMDPEVPEEEKGDMLITVHGSSALVERSIQDQTIMQMGAMVANPAFRINPAKWFEEMCRSKFMDPARVQFTEEEFAEMQKNQQPPPMPQIEVAKIRAQTDMQKLQADAAKSKAEMQLEREIAQIENQTQQTRIKVDTDRDTTYVQAEMQKNQMESELRMQELQMRKEIEILKYSTQQKISLEDAKVQLARDSMKLNVQRELAGAANALDVHKHRNPSPQVAKPLVEPAGRAPAGQAFTQ